MQLISLLLLALEFTQYIRIDELKLQFENNKNVFDNESILNTRKYVGQKIKSKINELTMTPELSYWYLRPKWQSRAKIQLWSFTACYKRGMVQICVEIQFPIMIRKF